VQLVCANENPDVIKELEGRERQLVVTCPDETKNTACSCYLNRDHSSKSYADNPGEILYESYKKSHSEWKNFGFMKQQDGCLLDVNGSQDNKFEITALCGEE
jgi:hypothetical protein